RTPATKDQGTVQIGKLPAIKIVGGNAGEWAAKKAPDTLEITSEKGKHSAELERLSKGGSKIPSLKVTTPMVDQSGQHLDYGAGAESLHRAAIMRLQSAAGNAAVGRVLSRQEQNASPGDPEVGFKQRADDVSAKLDATGHQLGNPLRGTGTAPSGTGVAGVFP